MFISQEEKRDILLIVLDAEKAGIWLESMKCTENNATAWMSVIVNGYIDWNNSEGITITDTGKKWLKSLWHIDVDNVQAHYALPVKKRGQYLVYLSNVTGWSIFALVTLAGACCVFIKLWHSS